MKKALPFFLVFVFFYSMVGFYLNFEIEQFRIKKEVKHKIINNLPDDELSLIKIAPDDHHKITWMEEGREFRYGGQMFDVVKIKKVSDTIYYFCFNDVKESKLLAHLDQLVKEQTDHSKTKMSHKKQITNYFIQENSYSQNCVETSILFLDYYSAYQSIVSDVLSPPPRSFKSA